MAISERDAQGMGYSFRFTRLTEALAAELANVLAVHQPTVRERFDKQGFCMSLPLNETIDVGMLSRVMSQHGVAAADVDVFASLLAETASDIIDFPDIVLSVLSDTGSRLTLSFTWVG